MRRGKKERTLEFQSGTMSFLVLIVCTRKCESWNEPLYMRDSGLPHEPMNERFYSKAGANLVVKATESMNQ